MCTAHTLFETREGRAGKAEQDRGRKSRTWREGDRYSSKGIQKGGFWISHENPQEQGNHEPTATTVTWCRGQSPTQGRSLWCHGTERREETWDPNSPNRWSGNQAGQRATVTWRRGPGATTGPGTHTHTHTLRAILRPDQSPDGNHARARLSMLTSTSERRVSHLQ